MTRRSRKKLLRKAEEALFDGNLTLSEMLFRKLWMICETSHVPLLDTAACTFNLIQCLHMQGKTEEAIRLSGEASNLIDRSTRLPERVAA